MFVMKYTRSFLKWAGNKFTCLNHIIRTLPKSTRLIEPFAGSGVVFINTDYPDYLIAEDNHDLINLFTLLQKKGDSFIQYCEPFFCDANNEAEQYYRLRTSFNQSTDPMERAALFLYLNHHGYNGLCRYNQDGGFNVPFGRYIKPKLPRERMQYFHHKSQHAIFQHSDFRKTFAQAKSGDLIYCDPPYVPLQQSSNFTAYTKNKFTEADQIALAELSMASANRGITVIISNHDTEFTRHYYRESQILSFPVHRHISRDIHNRVPVQELLAIFRVG
jgi:DNA adenine methylase